MQLVVEAKVDQGIPEKHRSAGVNGESTVTGREASERFLTHVAAFYAKLSNDHSEPLLRAARTVAGGTVR